MEQSLPHILLVEDDQRLAAMVKEFLELNGFRVSIETRGDDAIGRIQREQPEAVILDVNLPGADGFHVCRSVRPTYSGTIVMLTARGEEIDEVLGLDAGADDYIAKPVRPRALLARLHSHFRRQHAEGEADQPIRVGTLLVDPPRRAVELDASPVDLTSAEFDLLYLLARHAGKPLSRADIYLEIHGLRYDGVDRSIDLRISRLRKKLGDDPSKPRRIKSVRGVGYMLSLES